MAEPSSRTGSDPRLRPACPGDADAVRELVFGVMREHGLEPDPSGADADLHDVPEAYVARGGRFDVLVDEADRVLGSVGLYPVDARTVELRAMYLAAPLRGRGLGRRMLEHALARAREAGFEEMVLETATAMRAAIALYERSGFVTGGSVRCAGRCDRVMRRALRDGPVVRPADERVVADLARLAGVLGYPVEVEAMRRRLLELDAGVDAVLVAELSGRVVGWTHAAERTSLESGRSAEIVGLVVDPACRRQGVARCLVDAAQAWAERRGLAKVRVRTRVEREDARAFYRAAGFELVKTQDVYERKA